MPPIGPRNVQHLAAAFHGEQIIFVQDNSPNDSVYGALWWKVAERELYIWLDEWILIFFDGEFDNIEELNGLIEEPEVKSYVLITKTKATRQLSNISYMLGGVSVGFTFDLTLDDVIIHSGTVNSSPVVDDTINYVIPEGSILKLVVTSLGATSPTDFSFTLGFEASEVPVGTGVTASGFTEPNENANGVYEENGTAFGAPRYRKLVAGFVYLWFFKYDANTWGFTNGTPLAPQTDDLSDIYLINPSITGTPWLSRDGDEPVSGQVT